MSAWLQSWLHFFILPPPKKKFMYYPLIATIVYRKKFQRSRKEYVMWTCFEFWPIKNTFRKLWANESLVMACLQIHRELLSVATFLRVHSNSKEVLYLSWRNTYCNLKTTWHIKVKFFLWTKLLENLLLAEYLISVAAPLKPVFNIAQLRFPQNNIQPAQRNQFIEVE